MKVAAIRATDAPKAMSNLYSWHRGRLVTVDDPADVAGLVRLFLYQSGDNVDGQSDDDDIEEESQHAVGEHHAPQLVIFDLHIRYLEGHPHDKRKIHEI